MRSEYQVWQDELAGRRSGLRSSWILVAIGVAIVAVGLVLIR